MGCENKDAEWFEKFEKSCGCKAKCLPNGWYFLYNVDAGGNEIPAEVRYWSKRYKKYITACQPSYDGATGAKDIPSKGWVIHDQICINPYFDDGTPITAWMAATILYDILKEEEYWWRARRWRYATFTLGCKASRDNGWF